MLTGRHDSLPPQLKSRRSVSTVVAAVIIIIIVAVAGIIAVTLLSPGATTTTATRSSTSSTTQSSASSSLTSASSAPTLTPFAFGYTGAAKGTFTPTMYQVGIALDSWKKYGLNVSFVNFAGGEGPLISALVAGQIQVGDAGTLSLISALSSGAKIKLFGTEMYDAAWTIAVPANSSITSISQLKGTKSGISITNVGSGTWSASLFIMGAAGLKEGSDYTLVQTGTPAAQFVALQQGKVPATCLTIPSLIGSSNRLHFPIRYIANSSSIYPKPWIEYGFIAAPQFISDHPASLKAFINGYVDAYNYFKNNPQWAINFLTDYYGVNATFAKVIYGITVSGFTANTTVDPQALQNVQNLAIKTGVIPGNQTLPPISQWYQNVT